MSTDHSHTSDEAPVKSGSFLKSLKRIFYFFFFLMLLIVAGYLYYEYFFVYSTGSREGNLYKFSKKGTAFKTYEGELVQPGFKGSPGNFNSNNFYFSVDNDSLAKVMDQDLGTSVRVHYKQYLHSLPWRGDNYSDKGQEGQYIVDGVQKDSDTN